MDSRPRKRHTLTSNRIDRTAPASVVVEKFGGLTPFCEMNELPTSTVHSWLVAGLIPARRQARILQVAAANRVAVSPADFVPLAQVAA